MCVWGGVRVAAAAATVSAESSESVGSAESGGDFQNGHFSWESLLLLALRHRSRVIFFQLIFN